MKKRRKVVAKSTVTDESKESNKIGDEMFVFRRIGLTKLLDPENDLPYGRAIGYSPVLHTDRKKFQEFCDKPSLLKNKTIGDLLELEPLYGPFRMKDEYSVPFDEDFNLSFGPEFNDTANPDEGIYVRKDYEGYINLLTDKVNYIDIYHYDKNEARYAPLDSLPAELLPWRGENGRIHGKLEMSYCFNEPYKIEFDFATTNDVLTRIKREYVKMHNKEWSTFEVNHAIIFLRVEILRFNPKTGDFKLFIGS